MKRKVRSLQDLAALKKAMDEEAAHARLREAEAARRRQERDLFAQAVGPVMPLKSAGRAELRRALPLPIPRQRELDEAEALREALSDEVDVESLLETDDGLSFRRHGIGPETVRKLRRGVWSIQAHLDLHGLRREEARDALAGFLVAACGQGLRCVRVVHGKGNGSPGREPVLKDKVKRWLAQKPEVIAFTQARAPDGGNGALIVLLGASRAGARPRRPRRPGPGVTPD